MTFENQNQLCLFISVTYGYIRFPESHAEYSASQFSAPHDLSSATPVTVLHGNQPNELVKPLNGKLICEASGFFDKLWKDLVCK